MHCRTVFQILIFILLPLSVLSQAQLNSKQVEEKTYQLLNEKKWDELLTLGHSAIHNNIDYYYLQLRMGIAFYSKGKYRLAIPHFRKSIKHDPTSNIAREYLYWCYVFTDQYEHARAFSVTFDDSLKKTIRYNTFKPIHVVFAEGGIKQPSATQALGTATYLSVGLNHSVARRFSVSHAVSYYRQTVFGADFLQTQYYISANVPLGKGWLLSPAFQPVQRSFTSTITIPGRPPGGPLPPTPPTTTKTTMTSNAYIYAIQISKQLTYGELGYSFAHVNIDGFMQYINQITTTAFPLGNNRLAVGNLLYIHYEDKNGTSYAFNPFIGGRPLKYLYLQLNYFENQNENIIERNGNIVNNSPDLTRTRWTFIADFLVYKYISIYGIVVGENKRMPSQDTYTISTYLLGLKFYIL